MGAAHRKILNGSFPFPISPCWMLGSSSMPRLGNHDNTNESFYAPYNMNGATYYTFKKGNVRFFALNSNYMDPKQLAWLENELKSAGDGDWKVCYFHHPLYSSGKTHGSSIDLRQVLEPLFIKYHVDVVFSGHDHVYERVKPQNGIYYFTEGASGELRPGDLNQSTITAKGYDSDNTFMLVEFAGSQMNFQTISRAGQTVDSGVIDRQVRSSMNSSPPGPSVPRSAVWCNRKFSTRFLPFRGIMAGRVRVATVRSDAVKRGFWLPTLW